MRSSRAHNIVTPGLESGGRSGPWLGRPRDFVVSMDAVQKANSRRALKEVIRIWNDRAQSYVEIQYGCAEARDKESWVNLVTQAALRLETTASLFAL